MRPVQPVKSMFSAGRLVRWFAVGCVFTVLTLSVLYLLVEFGRFHTGVATLVAGEMGLLARFVVNDMWVFREATPTLRRLGHFHVATAGSFAVWWLAGNALTRIGAHYMLAAVAATSISAGCNLVTNFAWIWRNTKSY